MFSHPFFTSNNGYAKHDELKFDLLDHRDDICKDSNIFMALGTQLFILTLNIIWCIQSLQIGYSRISNLLMKNSRLTRCGSTSIRKVGSKCVTTTQIAIWQGLTMSRSHQVTLGTYISIIPHTLSKR